MPTFRDNVGFIAPHEIIACVAVLGALGCRSAPPPAPTTSPSATSALFVAPDAYDFAGNPALLDRVTATPHGYFRFVNIAFAQEVCRRFEEHLGESPRVNLHGDAHIEQYAITDLGRGLTDFDDSTAGPAAIDLVRFGVSLTLTARALGYSEEVQTTLQNAFLAGYRRGLADPSGVPEPPRMVVRLQKDFTFDRKKYFAWVSTVMKPVVSSRQTELKQAWGSYIELVRSQEPGLPQTFFDIVEIGSLAMGIGSALDEKYLLRVAGQTADPLDDVVLEVKEVRDLSGIDCITGNGPADPFRILVGQSRIAYTPYRYLGFLRMHKKTFWVHSWVDNYRELSIDKLMGTDPEDLAEVVYDAGVQLGRGHTDKIAAPLGPQLRQAQLELMDGLQSTFRDLIVQMTLETESAWRQFKARAAREGLDPKLRSPQQGE